MPRYPTLARHLALASQLMPLLACSDATVSEIPPGPSSSTTGDFTGDSPDLPTDGGPSGDDGPLTTSGATGSESSGSSDAWADGVCGDGVVDAGEGCDDGPANDAYAACTDVCQPNICGDGFVLLGVEGCDEGPANVDSGYCRADCQLGVCGDGFVLAGLEECDAADAASDVYGECDAECTLNRCGDGQLDPGVEECDAGANNGVDPRGETGTAGCSLECGLAGRRLFVSSLLFDGDLGTRAGADLACQNMAEAAGFKHAEGFRALLADAEVDPGDFVLEDAAGRPFISPSGQILGASYAALLQHGPGDGITMTETGETLYAQRVWTNLNVAGEAYSQDPASTCTNWTSAALAATARVGRNAPPPADAAALAEWKAEKMWLSFTNVACKYEYRLYCIEAE